MECQQDSDDDYSHGREAKRPYDIPGKGWMDIGKRVMREQTRDHVSIVAAGVAFYILLALFPALAAAVSLYALAADPNEIQSHLQALQGIIPEQAHQLLSSQVQRLAQNAGGLGLAAIGGLLVALWSSASGVKGLMIALNIVYDEEEKRGLIKYNAVALVLTLAAIIGGLIALTLVAVFPALLGQLGLGGIVRTTLSLLRWPILALGLVVALAILYRYAPSRDKPRWQWVSLGSVVATVFWVIASILFSIYISNFGNYNATYGSLGAAVILMLWLYLSAYVVLLGGELNAEMEHQTKQDTTAGDRTPLGERGAHVADTVARSE